MTTTIFRSCDELVKTSKLAAFLRLISIPYGLARYEALNKAINPINQKYQDGKSNHPLKYTNRDSKPPDGSGVEPVTEEPCASEYGTTANKKQNQDDQGYSASLESLYHRLISSPSKGIDNILAQLGGVDFVVLPGRAWCNDFLINNDSIVGDYEGAVCGLFEISPSMNIMVVVGI